MDLIETLRSTGAVRDFLPDAVDDEVVAASSTTRASRRVAATARAGG